MSELPSKLFFRIGEVAGLVGVEPHVLRYWEREFRSIRPTKSKKGQRVYSRKDVENLLRVRDLLYRDGYTIAGAKKQMQRGGVTADLLEQDPREVERTGTGETTASNLAGNERVAAASAVLRSALRSEQASQAARTEDVAASLAHATRILLAEDRLAAEPTTRVDPRVREELKALRAEVESFLLELDDASASVPPPR